jgi:hypothetical protein
MPRGAGLHVIVVPTLTWDVGGDLRGSGCVVGLPSRRLTYGFASWPRPLGVSRSMSNHDPQYRWWEHPSTHVGIEKNREPPNERLG